MSTWPSKEMLTEAHRSYESATGRTSSGAVEAAVSGALRKMPRATGWLWCERELNSGGMALTTSRWCSEGGCPGPHRRVLLGQEVGS